MAQKVIQVGDGSNTTKPPYLNYVSNEVPSKIVKKEGKPMDMKDNEIKSSKTNQQSHPEVEMGVEIFLGTLGDL